MLEKQSLPPMYARAVARIKFGKYSEAEWEIIRELEKHENDFDGWMMLAELYATRFNDVAEAEQTILELCNQPDITPSQLSVALHKLADWHLNLSGDPQAARRALQVICSRLPDTHLARMAWLRHESLPRTGEELKELTENRPVPLPALHESESELNQANPTEEVRQAAAQEASRLSERLKQNPDDPDLRERFARILAESLGQVDLAIQQVRLLTDMPDQASGRRAEWLAMMAAWELRYRQDAKAASELLERIVSEHGGTPQALAARRKLRLMQEERQTAQMRQPIQPKPRIE